MAAVSASHVATTVSAEEAAAMALRARMSVSRTGFASANGEVVEKEDEELSCWLNNRE